MEGPAVSCFCDEYPIIGGGQTLGLTLSIVFDNTDGLQMSIKCPTSGGQTHDEEADVQRTFHLERSSFFYLPALMVRTRCSTY